MSKMSEIAHERLIAAAPDLLEACRMAFDWMRDNDGHMFTIGNGSQADVVFNALDHAIVKAIQG